MTAFLAMETIKFPPWEQSEGIHPAGIARDSLDNLKYGVYRVQRSAANRQTDACVTCMSTTARAAAVACGLFQRPWRASGWAMELSMRRLKSKAAAASYHLETEMQQAPGPRRTRGKSTKKNGSMVLLRNRRLSKAGHCRQNSPEALRLWPTATAVLDLSYPCVLTASWV